MTGEPVGDLAATSGPEPATTTGKIVVGVDGSPLSDCAVLWAADQAEHWNRRLLLAHAVRPPTPYQMSWLATAGILPDQVRGEMHSEAVEVVEAARALVQGRRPDAQVETSVTLGDPRQSLLDLGKHAALTVVGTRGHAGVTGLLLGSVSGTVLRHCAGPVAVVRPETAGRGVLVGVDGSADTLPAVAAAFAEASMRGRPLTVVHCRWDALVGRKTWAPVAPTEPEAPETGIRLAESVAGFREQYPDVVVELVMARGAAEDCLVDMSEDHELLVIGRSGGWWSQHMGWAALATTVAEHAHTPVLVVP